jgi:acetyl-CoA carboxylase biotin carboxyl carrier protein
MIDIRKLKELVRLMVTNDLSEIDLRDSEEQVTLRRPTAHSAPIVSTGYPSPGYGQPPHHAAHSGGAALGAPGSGARPGLDDLDTDPIDDDADAASAASGAAGLVAIESPMVGTFYSKPDPNSPNFINVGDAINPQTVVCLVEAMKIFNEIKAEVAGRVEKMLVKNGQAVEFGQKLFLIKPE